MSSNAHSGRAPSETELLDWMKLKPRTLGWDAWLAYDRHALNASLWRDYIERSDRHPFAHPFSGKVVVSANAVWEYLYDVRLGAPQVSFEQSQVSSSRITMTARALSGTQLTVETTQGSPRRITRIAQYTPLQAPRVVAEAFIDDNDGAAIAARQVRMDLTASPNYQFSFPGPYQQQISGGTFFYEQISELPDTSHHCLLNLLGEWEGGALVPELVRPRPIPILDGQGNPTEDGAVLLMVAATGSEVGEHPDIDGDWKYPIPQGYHAALWIGGHCLMKRVVKGGIDGVSSGATFTYDNPDAPTTVTVTGGTLQALTFDQAVAPFESVTYNVQVPLTGSTPATGLLKVSRSETGLTLNWKASSFERSEASLLTSQSPEGETALDIAWRIQNTYEFTREQDGSLGLHPVGQGARWIKPVYRQGRALDPLHYQHFPELEAAIAAGLSTELAGIEARLLGGNELGEIDRLRFEGLACPGGAGMDLTSVHIPRDLALFGTFGARPGRFLLTPVQVRLRAGDTLQFETEPTQEGIEWTLEHLEGFDGDIGTVNSTGLYAAPAASAMDGRFIMAKVTASSAIHSSTAWISVVAPPLVLNPLVFASVSAGGKMVLSAGSLEDGDLEWSLTTSTGAMLEEPVPEDGTLSDLNNRVYVRGDVLSGGSFSVDEVTVRTPSGASATTRILVVEKQPLGTVRIADQTGVPAGQLQLEFDGGGSSPIEGAEWKVQIGDGAITPEGLYAFDPGSPLPYAAITAEFKGTGFTFSNFILLPIPLVDLDAVRRALD